MPTTPKNYTSHFGVYALIFNDKKDAILLIKKARGCYTGLYDLPGGAMEPHELLEETLTREVFEETGCYVTSQKQLGAFSVLFQHIEKGQEKVLRHLAAIYVAEISGTPRKEGESETHEDSAGCVWMPLSDISPKNAPPLVIEAVKRHSAQ